MAVVKEKDGVIYTINLRRLYWGKRTNRAKRAVRLVREFVARHFGVEPEDVKIDNTVNNYLWSRSITKPPARVQVYVTVKTESTEEGEKKVAYVTLANVENVEA
jgi:large subunit ribosomal protein L31e